MKKLTILILLLFAVSAFSAQEYKLVTDRNKFKALRTAVDSNDTTLSTQEYDQSVDFIEKRDTWNNIFIYFWVNGDDNDTASYTLYGRPNGNGFTKKLASGVVTAGTLNTTYEPLNPETAADTNDVWADTVTNTVSDAKPWNVNKGDDGNNRITCLYFDAFFLTDFYIEFTDVNNGGTSVDEVNAIMIGM